MQKVYIIKPDKPPYSLCVDSFANGFKHAGYYIEKSFSSELDNEYVKSFKPNIVMCFNFNELKEGFLPELHLACPNCKFIFDFLTKIDKKKDAENLKLLKQFNAEKYIFTADKVNLSLIDDILYLPNSINYKAYKTIFTGYKSNITLMSNPNNINVLKAIISLIIKFGRLDFYADEIDYMNSLENEIWNEYSDYHIKELYKQSYRGEAPDSKTRSNIFSSSLINIVPITQTIEGIDFRILEIAASSGFIICEENNEIKKRFDTGREIETYRGLYDLIDKVDFYIKNPDIARVIATNARSAAVNNHAIKSRILTIEGIINKEA